MTYLLSDGRTVTTKCGDMNREPFVDIQDTIEFKVGEYIQHIDV